MLQVTASAARPVRSARIAWTQRVRPWPRRANGECSWALVGGDLTTAALGLYAPIRGLDTASMLLRVGARDLSGVIWGITR